MQPTTAAAEAAANSNDMLMRSNVNLVIESQLARLCYELLLLAN